MALNEEHVFQLLTKRPERMVELANDHDVGWWPPNVWAGVSVENQEWADKRLPLLAQVPAKVRFVSLEPLLSAVDLRLWLGCRNCDGSPWIDRFGTTCIGEHEPNLSWVIVGAESGTHARPMHPDWARAIRDQCQEAGTPFWFKQNGEWLHESQVDRLGFLPPVGAGLSEYQWPDGTKSYRVGKKAAGALLDGKEYRARPYLPPEERS